MTTVLYRIAEYARSAHGRLDMLRQLMRQRGPPRRGGGAHPAPLRNREIDMLDHVKVRRCRPYSESGLRKISQGCRGRLPAEEREHFHRVRHRQRIGVADHHQRR